MNYYMSYLATVWLCGCVIWPTLYVLVIIALFCFVLNKGVWYTFAVHFIRYTRSTQGLRSAWVPGLTFVLRTALINNGEKSTIDKWNSSDILTQIDIIGLRSCCRFVYCLHIHVAKLPFHRWFQILTPPTAFRILRLKSNLIKTRNESLQSLFFPILMLALKSS